MMRNFLLTIVALAITIASFGQLTGPKSIPGDYATIAAAVADLNSQGVGTGGVTFNIAPGYTESITTPLLITATGTSGDPIIFQRDGAGTNPKITRTDLGTLTTSSLGAQGDAVIILQGSDYVTFDAIDVAATDAGIEYGYYLRKASVSDGCKNDVIKNATITMTKGTSAYVVGIYSSNNDAASTVSSATGITVSSTGGRNENLQFTGNTISNVFSGILLRGFNHSTSPYDFQDQNNVVGVSGSGNTIKNFAGNSASSAYGVYLIYQTSPNVSYNTINNALEGANATSTLYGIFMSSTNAGGTFIANNNTITLGQGATSGAHCIYIAQPCTSITINSNTFSYGTFASTTTSYFIQCSNATNNITIDGNSTSGTINKTGAGQLEGYYNFGGPTGGTATITNNNFSNITLTGASAFYGIRHYTSVTQVNVISNNTISNITGGTSAVYGIYQGYGAAGSIVNGNNIFNLSTTGTGSLYGISLGNSTAPVNLSASNNTIRNLSASGSSAIYGIYNVLGADTKIFKNQLFNFSGSNAGSTVYGIYVGGGALTTIYNNFISDLKAPAATGTNAIVGISMASGTTVNCQYNTVYLNATSTSATTFGSSGIYTGTSVTVDLRNNNIVNVSTPVGTSYTVAHRRSGAATTSLTATTGYNNYYAGTGTNNVIYYNGTTSYATVPLYQAALAPKESNSVGSNPPFLNVSSTPYDLHISTSTPTFLESGGTSITAITDDIDGNPRASTPDIGADEFAGLAGGTVNPGAFTATAISSQQIDLTYTLNPAGDNVLIVWNNTGTFSTPSGDPPGAGNSFAGGTVLSYGTATLVNHTSLTPGTLYYYMAFSRSLDDGSYSSGVNASATPGVAPPTAFTAAPVSSSQINLAYTLNAQSNNVLIATNSTSTFGAPVNGNTYSVGNALPTAGTVIYVGPLAAFSHTGLPANTKYYYQIWSVDAFAYYSATGATANATTLCDNLPLPLSEGFNASTMPACWAQQFVTGTLSFTFPTTGTGTPAPVPQEGTNQVMFNSYSNSGSQTRLVTPPITTTGISSVDAQFQWYFSSTGGSTSYTTEGVQVQYSTNGTTWTNAGTLIRRYGAVTGWSLQTVTLPSGAGNQSMLFVGFLFTSNAGYDSYMDAVTIKPTPACLQPTGLTVSNIAYTTADLSWTASPSGGAIGYDWEVRTSGLPGSGSTGLDGFGSTATTSAQVSGLTGNTPYTLYVKTNCGSSYSDWPSQSFSTLSCNIPTAVTVSNIQLTSATISWTAPVTGSPAGYDYEVRTSGTAGSGAAGLITSGSTTSPTVSANISGLTQATVYYVYVRTVCYTNFTSSWTSSTSFSTSCPIVTTLSENFDGVTTPSMPPCWMKVGTSGSASTQSSSAASSPNCLYIYSSSSTATATVAMPEITNAGAGTHWLRFKLRGNFSAGEDILVGYMTDRSNAATFVTVATVNAATLSYVEKTVDLGTAPGASTTIAFRHPGVLGNSCLIDDVYWEIKPTCFPPTDLTTANINYTTVDISWTAPINGSPQNYPWEIRSSGAPGSGSTGLAASGTATGVSVPGVVGLTGNTAYTLYVQTYCGGTDYSSWASKTFSTLSCNVPTGVTVSTIAQTTATLTWVAPATGSPQGYEYEVRTSGAAGSGATGLAASGSTTAPTVSAGLSGLTAATTYSVYVRSVCVPGFNSSWTSAVTFSTSCNPSTLPTTMECFEGTAYPPVCWSKYTGLLAAPSSLTTTTSGWVKDDWLNVTSPVNKAARLEVFGTTTKYWLMTPQIDLGAGSATLQLEFDLGMVGFGTTNPPATTGTDDKFAVVISTDGGTTWTSANTLRLWDNVSSPYIYNSISPSGQHVTIPLAGYSGTVMIGFYGESTTTNADNDLMIDNVIIQEPPACAAPTTLTATEITTTTAKLGWTETGSATSWDIEYGLAPYTFTGVPTMSNVVNPQLVQSLLPASSYSFKVRAHCSTPGQYSNWNSNAYTFTTACGTMTVPYTQNFDGVVAPNIPPCMTVTDDNGDAIQWVTHSGTLPSARSAPNCMQGYYNASQPMNDWFFTPPITLPVGTYKVSFWYRGSGTTFIEKLEVKWGNAPNAAGMTNGPIFDNSNITNSTYVEGTGNLVVTVAGDYYVGWHQYSATNKFYLGVDDISITPETPVIPAVVSITGTFNGTPTCYNATDSIFVANYAMVDFTQTVSFVAGNYVRFYDHTTIKPATGGMLHAYIKSATMDWCSLTDAPMVAAATGQEETMFSLEQANFTLYPNPTNGNFTLVQKGEKTYGNVKVEVYSMRGDKVLTENMIGEKKHEFRFSDMPNGLYFVKVVAEDYVETIKLVKTR